TTYDNLVIMLFLGDYKSEFVLSSFLLKRYLKEKYPNKYFILCGWEGHSGLFPYIDEYWAIKDTSVDILFDKAIGFNNLDTKHLFYQQSLNKWFENIIQIETFSEFYQNGFKQEFFDKFKKLMYNLPSLPSTKL